MGRGCPFPSRLRRVEELTPAGSGAESRPKPVLVHLELEITHLMETNFVFFSQRIFSHIHILLNIKLHCIFVPIMQLKRLPIFFTPLCVLLGPSGYA